MNYENKGVVNPVSMAVFTILLLAGAGLNKEPAAKEVEEQKDR
jgi:hypothetical protein